MDCPQDDSLERAACQRLRQCFSIGNSNEQRPHQPAVSRIADRITSYVRHAPRTFDVSSCGALSRASGYGCGCAAAAGRLLVGITYGKTLAQALGKPLVQ